MSNKGCIFVQVKSKGSFLIIKQSNQPTVLSAVNKKQTNYEKFKQ